jgi:hypothetical protein
MTAKGLFILKVKKLSKNLFFSNKIFNNEINKYIDSNNFIAIHYGVQGTTN